jgi:hypothetical protein
MATSKVTVFQELSAAYKLPKRKQKESAEDYSARVAEVISEGDEDVFEGLSKAAQKWYNAAADAINEEETVPAIPGLEEEEGPAPAAAPAAKKPVKAAAKAKAEDEDEDEEDGGGKRRGRGPGGVADAVRKILCRNPAKEMTLEDVQAALDKQGVEYNESHVAQMVRDINNVLRVLRDLGKV